MKTVCPRCKQKYAIDNAYNGFEIKCPNCDNDFIVQIKVEVVVEISKFVLINFQNQKVS